MVAAAGARGDAIGFYRRLERMADGELAGRDAGAPSSQTPHSQEEFLEMLGNSFSEG